MLRWSMLSGAPRFGEALPSQRLGRWKGSVQVRFAAGRRAALLFGALTVVALADATQGLLAALDVGFGSRDLFLRTALPVALLAAGLGIMRATGARKLPRPQRSPLALAAFALTTLALGLALAAAAAPDGPLAPWAARFPSALVASRGTGDLAADAVPLAVLLLAPFAGGLHAHANALALGVSGTAPRLAPLLAAWRAESPRDLSERHAGGYGRYATAAPRHWAYGFGLAGLLLWDLAYTVAARTSARLARQVVDRVHVDADLRTIAEALSARGLSVEARGRVLVVEMPRPAPTEVTAEPEDAGFRRVVTNLAAGLAGVADDRRTEVVRIRAAVVYLPPVESASVLNLRGTPRAVRRLRRLLETELLYVGTFAWSLEARRLERRLNSLAVEAAYAGTVEERAVLLAEATHLERVAHSRAFLEEEWTLLAAWKAVRLRALIQDRILSAPPEVKREGRAVAPAATLLPNVEKLVAAGGLAAVRTVVYVPYFVVPVQLSWGEAEFVVNSVTGKVDRAESRMLLDTMRARGTRFFVDTVKATQFIKRPVSGGAVYGEVRRVLRHDLNYWGTIHLDEALVETVYVPYVDVDGKFVNAITGKEAREVRAALLDVLPLRS